MRAKSNSIRIIAGRWRGRRLPVVDSRGLRPSTDRMRETLFNWLMHDVANARCLDLFAGSGALGLESLSRGASYVEFVESQKSVRAQIIANLAKLNVDEENARCAEVDALLFLQKGEQLPFDLVFLDPPFESDLLPRAINRLADSQLLADDAMVYVEQPSGQPSVTTPTNWQLHKQLKAGQSLATLYRLTPRLI